jgi:CheY-like chemotaxis protein
MPQARGALGGCVILVVEDTYLIADLACGLLKQDGCTVLGPASRLAAGLELARGAETLDGALLDINLDGELCFPIARALAERSVPFIFLTGYERAAIPAEFSAVPLLTKPVDAGRLIEVARVTFAARAAMKDP